MQATGNAHNSARHLAGQAGARLLLQKHYGHTHTSFTSQISHARQLYAKDGARTGNSGLAATRNAVAPLSVWHFVLDGDDTTTFPDLVSFSLTCIWTLGA
jgi:hypothetical protein